MVGVVGRGFLGVVMDPVTIGTAVAVLAGKKLVEKVGEQAGESGWGLANAILGKVRGWFSMTDKKAAAQLEALETATEPDGAAVKALAVLVDKRLEAAPDLGAELAELVARAGRDPVLGPVLSQAGLVVGGASTVITQTTTGDGNVVIGQAGGSVNVTGAIPTGRSQP